MAILLDRKVVKDTDTYNDYAIGFILPLQFGNNTFIQSYKTIDQVKSNIKNLLLTSKGERVMQPEFGSGLDDILFDFNDDMLPTKIESEIESSINKWLPYITIDSILIDLHTNDVHRADISINFKVGDNISLESVTFTI